MARPIRNFRILTKDFNAALSKAQVETNKLAGNAHKTEKERDAFNRAAAAFLRALSNVQKQDKAADALSSAAAEGKINVMENAFAQGVSVDYIARNQYTLLASAAAGEQVEMTKYLIGKKANLDLKGKYGLSPVEFAVIRDNAEIFTLLRKAGARIDKKELTALAKRNQSTAVLQELKKIKPSQRTPSRKKS